MAATVNPNEHLSYSDALWTFPVQIMIYDGVNYDDDNNSTVMLTMVMTRVLKMTMIGISLYITGLNGQ